MNGSRPSLLMPALAGGAAAGVLSGIPWINCLCCLWMIGGGALAAWLLARESRAPVRPGDGALVGAFSGVVAAGINTLLGIPFAAANMDLARRLFERMASYAPEAMPEGWEAMVSPRSGPVSIAGLIINLALSAIVFAVIGALGGVIGAALAGKSPAREAAPPLAPPPAPPAA